MFVRNKILLSLEQSPKTAYELIKEGVGISGSIYKYLKLLESGGFITGFSDNVGNRRRIRYKLTGKGLKVSKLLWLLLSEDYITD